MSCTAQPHARIVAYHARALRVWTVARPQATPPFPCQQLSPTRGRRAGRASHGYRSCTPRRPLIRASFTTCSLFHRTNHKTSLHWAQKKVRGITPPTRGGRNLEDILLRVSPCILPSSLNQPDAHQPQHMRRIILPCVGGRGGGEAGGHPLTERLSSARVDPAWVAQSGHKR